MLTVAVSGLPAGGSLTVLSAVDPQDVVTECNVASGGLCDWRYVTSGPDQWEVQLTKVGSRAPAKVVHNTARSVAEDQPSGVVWQLAEADRGLQVTDIRLSGGQVLGPGYGPDFDVLVHVVSGLGRIDTGSEVKQLAAGVVVWLPRKSLRTIVADATGLRYLSVHATQP